MIELNYTENKNRFSVLHKEKFKIYFQILSFNLTNYYKFLILLYLFFCKNTSKFYLFENGRIFIERAIPDKIELKLNKEQ
jgi:hypothetical protein